MPRNPKLLSELPLETFHSDINFNKIEICVQLEKLRKMV